jgi:glycosyltransferase involved in cell wall biosynthesis
MRKIRIMMLSDSVLTPTGFANQTRELCKRLSQMPEFEIYHVAWNSNGSVLMPPVKMGDERAEEELNFTILSGGREPYAKDVLPEYFAKYKPDIFWCLLDSFMLFPWITSMSIPAKSVMYFPSDGNYFPTNCEHVLKKFDTTVAMSKFAQNQIADSFNMHTEYIPHAINPNMFYPLSEQEKRECKAAFGIPQDAFVFGDVGRNQGRKMMGMEIMAFGEFMKRNPGANAYLFMWTDFLDVAAHSDLMNLARRYDVAHRIIGKDMMKFYQGAPTQMMNRIYNAMDVKISTTTGEGFGITTIEAMAAEIPVIMTDYTTTAELLEYPYATPKPNDTLQLGTCGIGVPVAAEIPGTWDVYRGFVNISKFVDAMEMLYAHPEMRKQLGVAGRPRVLDNYSWDGDKGMIRQWVALFKRMVE